MTLIHLNDREFIERLTELILANLEDENLCVKELAAKSGMSAPSLNQRLYIINKIHLSRFIREVRLHKALELLQNGKYTAAEVAYQVGFSSPTYFNKCFHDLYGYPNPLNDRLFIDFELEKRTIVNFLFCNTAGTMVKSFTQQTNRTGSQHLEINIQDLLPGIYFLRMQAGNEVGSKKVVKL
jgi:AraC-like DNA-binding protein